MSGTFKKVVIIVVALGAIIFVILSVGNKPKTDNNLVSSNPTGDPITGIAGGINATAPSTSLGTDEFLTKLLSIKNIELNGSIFEEPAFSTLKDSSIILIQDGTEGRPNPFAPIGFENLSTGAIQSTTPTTSTSTTPSSGSGTTN